MKTTLKQKLIDEAYRAGISVDYEDDGEDILAKLLLEILKLNTMK